MNKVLVQTDLHILFSGIVVSALMGVRGTKSTQKRGIHSAEGVSKDFLEEMLCGGLREEPPSVPRRQPCSAAEKPANTVGAQAGRGAEPAGRGLGVAAGGGRGGKTPSA